MHTLAIIGAGPVGLALAARLSQITDHRIVLIDARNPSDAVKDPRTLAINAGSQALLSQLKAWPQSHHAIRRILISQESTPFASVELTAESEGVEALGYTVRYGALTQALLSAVEGKLEMRFGLAASKVEPSGQVQFADGTSQTFDAVLVCEGGLFAEQAAAPIHRDYAQTALIAEVTAEKPLPGGAFERFTHEGTLALLPVGDKRYAMVWCVKSEIAAERSQWSLKALAREISLRFGTSMGQLTLQSKPVQIPLGLNAHKALASGVCVRLGNAAQTLHPVAGQGFNLGLRDAWQLADSLSKNEPLQATLARYASHREADRTAMLRGTDFLARAFTWELPLADSARGAALALLATLPPARRALAQWMMYGLR
jgi:2-octaprenyl-6-methoxyphenol hydroxylase